MDTENPTPISLEQWRAINEQMADLRTKYDLCKSQLEKYTNNDRHKRYYEQNKDRVKANAKQYLNKLKEDNPEKLKEYRHRAYIKRKTLQTTSEAELPQ
jgi:N-glycosylase/DNA lyase